MIANDKNMDDFMGKRLKESASGIGGLPLEFDFKTLKSFSFKSLRDGFYEVSYEVPVYKGMELVGAYHFDVPKCKIDFDTWEITFFYADETDEKNCKPIIGTDQRHGYWINHDSYAECSCCHEEQYGFDNGRNFCQNCGAIMDEKKCEPTASISVPDNMAWECLGYTYEQAVEFAIASKLLQKAKSERSHPFLSDKKWDENPLTLTELKKMDDERVWLYTPFDSMYALVSYHSKDDKYYNIKDGEDVWLTNNEGGRDTYEKLIAMGGAAYREKPTNKQR